MCVWHIAWVTHCLYDTLSASKSELHRGWSPNAWFMLIHPVSVGQSCAVIFKQVDVPESVRRLIIIHYNEQCSYRQIARMLNQPKSTVADIVMRNQNTHEISSGRTGRCGRPRLLTQRDDSKWGGYLHLLSKPLLTRFKPWFKVQLPLRLLPP